MANTYTIQHISDLLTVPPEDIEEVLADARAAYDIARATLHAMRETGSKEPNLREFMPKITFVCDGKAEHKVELRARPTKPDMEGFTMSEQTEMPRYKCHKEVHALKIEAVERDCDLAAEEGRETDGSALLHFTEPGYAPLRVDAEFVRTKKPEPGGYYVVYYGGYASFSPAEAFEAGYTRM